MKKHIAEELPARKHAPAAAAASAAGDKKEAGGKSPEKRVKQAIYDIRYRARREELPLRNAYSQYMQNSNMSQQEKTLVKQKLFGKGGMQSEDFNIEEFASNSVASALYKVFVEGVKSEEPIILTYMEKLETSEHRKYKVRVTGTDGRSYVRYATRDKISALRANPNIKEVEMTGYGEPYEGEKKKGEQTARAKRGEKLDPVGKEDSDVNNDGKVDKTDKYLQHRRNVRGAAIAKKGGVSEEFIGEVNSQSENSNASDKPIDVMKGKNTVVINPEAPGTGTGRGVTSSLQVAHHEMNGPILSEKALSRAQQRFMGMVYAAKKGDKPASPEVAKAAEGMTKKEAKKFAKTKHKGLPEKVEEGVGGYDDPVLGPQTPLGQAVRTGVKVVKGAVTGAVQGAQGSLNTAKTKPVKEAADCGSDDKEKERDTRGDYAKINLIKNKLRAMGAKNPIVVATEDVEQIDELNRLEKEQGKKSGGSSDPAYRAVKKTIRGMEGKPVGQQKKVPGKKPPAAGQYGGPRSPEQKVAMRRAAAQRAQDMMHSPRD